MKNYYAVFGLPIGCEVETIRETYRTLIQQYIDDREKFAEITDAYETLTTPNRRAEYDKAMFGDTVLQNTSTDSLQMIDPHNDAPVGERRCPMGDTAHCPVINARIPITDTYCPECGFELASLPAVTAAGAQVEMPIQQPSPFLEEDTGRQHRLAPGTNMVGREAADIVIFDKTISRQHARIQLSADGSITVEDLGSTNGSQINGERMTPHFPRTVFDNDTVRFGSVRLLLRLPTEADQAKPKAESDLEIPSVLTPPTLQPETGDEMKLPSVSESDFGASFGEERLLAETRPAGGAKLISIRGDVVSEYAVMPGVTTFGRRAENNIVIRNDPYVSGTHAQIIAENGTYRLTDVGSTNGTLYKGEKMAPNVPVTLSPGDEIAIGGTIFRFERVTATE